MAKKACRCLLPGSGDFCVLGGSFLLGRPVPSPRGAGFRLRHRRGDRGQEPFPAVIFVGRHVSSGFGHGFTKSLGGACCLCFFSSSLPAILFFTLKKGGGKTYN